LPKRWSADGPRTVLRPQRVANATHAEILERFAARGPAADAEHPRSARIWDLGNTPWNCGPPIMRPPGRDAERRQSQRDCILQPRVGAQRLPMKPVGRAYSRAVVTKFPGAAREYARPTIEGSWSQRANSGSRKLPWDSSSREFSTLKGLHPMPPRQILPGSSLLLRCAERRLLRLRHSLATKLASINWINSCEDLSTNTRRPRGATVAPDTGACCINVSWRERKEEPLCGHDTQLGISPGGSKLLDGTLITTTTTTKNIKTTMKNSIAKTLALCSLSFSILASAAPVPWIGALGPGDSISIPAGKILIMEQVGGTNFGVDGDSLSAMVRITGPAAGGIGSNFTAVLTYKVPSQGTLAFPSPIRLGPGMTLTHQGGASFAIFGIALESQDFFAAVSPSIRSVTSDGAQLTAIVDARTTMPTRLSGESSTNLTTWTQTGVSIASSASNRRFSRITTPEDTSRKFVRARAARRTVAGNAN